MPGTDPQLQYDPNDPVHQTLQIMAQQGQLHPSAPAHDAMPPEGFVQTMMHNVVHNAQAAGDSNLLVRAISALEDVMNIPHSIAQAALGVTPESQMEASRAHPVVPQLSELIPMLAGPMGIQQSIMRLRDGQPLYHGSPEMTNMAADLALDPTTYLGVGLFKNLAKGAAKVGAPKAVQVGLEAASQADKVSSDAMGQVAQNMVALAGKGLDLTANRALVKMFPALAQWTEHAKTEQAMGNAVQWLTQYRGLTVDDLQTGVKAGNTAHILSLLPTELQGKVAPAHLEWLVNKLDPATPNLGAAMTDFGKYLQKDMGIAPAPKVIQEYTKLNQWFQSQALGSLNYLTQNLQSGAAMGQMVGVPAATTLGEAASNIGKIMRGEPFNTRGATELAGKTGVPIPYSLHETADRALNAMAPVSTNSTRDAIFTGILGGIGAGPAGAALGAAVGSRIAPISQRLRKSSQGIETVLREGGWKEGMSRALVDSMADMERVIVDGLTKPGARVSGRAVHQNFIDTIVKQVTDNGGQINPNKLHETLLNSVRITPDRADEITRALDDIFYNASQKGVGLSNKFNFDYADLSAVERVMSGAFPFSIWTMKAAPFLFEQEARHPVIGNIYRAEREASYQDQQQKGLTGRFAGTLPAPGSSILSAILGRPAEMYNDPIRAFLPFAGATGAMQRMQYDDPAQEGIMSTIGNALDVLGISPSPILDSIAHDTGMMGKPDNPIRGVLRSAAPVMGATALANRAVEATTGQSLIPGGGAIDLNAGQQKIEATIRKMFTGQEVTNAIEVASERRVDEMALRDLGTPIGSNDASVAPYVQARRTHTGPIWDRAKTEIQLEKGVQALAGFVSQDIQPQAILTPEEGAIREAKKEGTFLPPQVAHTIDQAAEKNGLAPADPKLVTAITQAVQDIAQVTGRPTPQPVADRLTTATNSDLDWISKEIYKFQVETDPVQQGYGASGTPEARAIGNAQSGMAHAGQGLPPQQQLEMMNANKAASAGGGTTYGPGSSTATPLTKGNIAASLEIPGQVRGDISKSTPYFDEYTAWKKTHPQGEVADFLVQKFAK